MSRGSIRRLAIGGTAVIYALAGMLGQTTRVAAQQASFVCSEMLGFSETEQWYQPGFISHVPNPGGWQLRWYSGGSVDLWADPNYAGWSSAGLVTHCSNGGSPDRVVMNVSGDYNTDPAWWARTTQRVIQNIRTKDPNVRQIALQPVVGGPNGGRCPTSDPLASQPFVRASFNYPYIKQGLAMDVGGDVVLGASPEVRSCADYLDWAGHLPPETAAPIGTNVAQFWAGGSAPAVAPAPVVPPAPAPAPQPAPAPADVAPPPADAAPPADATPAPDAAPAPEAAPAPDAAPAADAAPPAEDAAPPTDIAPPPDAGPADNTAPAVDAAPAADAAAAPPDGGAVAPAATSQMVTFDDLANPGRALLGQDPVGLIDWGSGAWWLSGPYGQFAGNSVSFNGAGPTNASFAFLSPHRLARLDVFNGGQASTTVSLTCDGVPGPQAAISPGQRMTLSTGFTTACATISVTSTNGWDTNFDNLLIDN